MSCKNNLSKVCKAVLLAGGMGTRFLPATKCMPKEFMPILNKPALQYFIEELKESGIEEVVIVINNNKLLIKKHFEPHPALESFLESKGQLEILKQIKTVAPIKITFAVQERPLGSANAVEAAQPYLTKGQPFVVINGDDLKFNAGTPVTKQLINCYYAVGGLTVVGGKEVPKEEVPKYGMLKGRKDGKLVWLTDIVEKPTPNNVTNTLVNQGSMVVNYEVFDKIKTLQAHNGEFQFTDAIKALAQEGRAVAYNYDGIWYDLGKVTGVIQANIEYGLRDPNIALQLKQYLKSLVKTF